ncbi:squalene synthase HpnC [bacterium]|nr:squalene synthase HpnC [bacterium]
MVFTKARRPVVSKERLSKTIETLARDPWAGDADRYSARRENFPVASLALPRRFRRPFHIIYAYCRGADNLADASPDTESALAALDIWQQQLEAAFDGKAAFPLFQRLQELIPAFPLTKQSFLDLLVAFRRDQQQTIYNTRHELLDYCKYSAIPVGRMLLQLFGKDEERFRKPADALCVGLQLANFWQDLSLDRPRREYLPTEDLARFGLYRESLGYQPTPPALEKLIQYEVKQTLPYFHAATELPKILRGRIGFEIELIRQGGMRVLTKVSRKGARVFYERPALRHADWLWITLRALF